MSESNESLLALISDVQMSTQCFHDASREDIVSALNATITDLIALYNRVNGQSLILADYTKIAREIQAIDKWSGEAFQKDDEVDIALQTIAQEIDFPRNGSGKRITGADLDIATEMRSRATLAKKEYHLYCYNNGSYKDAQASIASGGNWEIESFILPTLTVGMLNDEIHGNAVTDALTIANNAMDVFGHLEDAVYFITDENTKVLFYQDDSQNCKWMETAKPEPTEDKVEQVTIPVTIFITATGTNLSVKENEIRASFVSVFEQTLKQKDSDTFETEFAEHDLNVVETKVLCTEPITYHEIK